MQRYSKYFLDKRQNIEPLINSTISNYSISHKMSIRNIKIEEVHFYKRSNTINIQTDIYSVINDIRFDYEIFREAYINQRKQYKLLKAYLELKEDLICEEQYDSIEEACTIVINDYNEEVSQKALYSFLKNHRDYIDNYESNELAELLGLSYKKVNKLIKKKKRKWQK